MAEEKEKRKNLVDYKSHEEEVAGRYDSLELIIDEEDVLEEVNEKNTDAKIREKKKELEIVEDVTVKAPNYHEFIYRASEELRQRQQTDQLERIARLGKEAAASNKIAAQNLALTAKSLEQLILVARDMVNTLAQTFKDNLEAQRICYESLKVGEENIKNFDLLENPRAKRKTIDLELEKGDTEFKRIKLTKNQDVEVKNSNQSQSHFFVRLDYLKSKLDDFLDVIEPNETSNQNCSALSIAKKNRLARDEPKAQWVHNSNIKESKCHRCNKYGHWMRDCPLSNQHKWFCYYCQAIKDHKGDDCPTIRGDNSREKEIKRKPKDGTKRVHRVKDVESWEHQNDTDES